MVFLLSSPVECVRTYEVAGGGNGGGKYERSVLCCAWKAPRTLTGLLASTAQPQWSFHESKPWKRRRRRGIQSVDLCKCRYEALDIKCCIFVEAYGNRVLRNHGKSTTCSHPRRRGKLCCSSSSCSDSSGAISHETLWEDLKPDISYLSPDELELVNKALKLAFEAHSGQKRRSGEPFIIHPVEVARILGELELDWESIAAGLLHDTVEDTNVVTFERIEKEFGATVRNIVEGETKVSKLGKLQCKDVNNSQDVKADDLRQMFLAMTEEVRVIIVKLADRLHNMRTLSHMPNHKQASISMETLQVFAPLAKLLGMYQIKSGLENLSFMYTNPHDFTKIKKRVEDLYKEHEKELLEAKNVLVQKIEEDQFLHLMTVKTEVHSVRKEL